MSTVGDRLPRLLALVPYLLARPGLEISAAAADFGVSERQLRRDLELLWMCGLPGYGPGDLIDLSFDEDTVSVTFDAGMHRPLRLTHPEATALLVALRALAETPGLADTDAVRRALAKIESAAGGSALGEAEVVLGLSAGEGPGAGEVRDAVRRALDGGRVLRIRYYTASRDAVTDRVVDPVRLLVIEGHSYLEAWCRSAAGVRLFRLDRIDGIALLDEASSLLAGTARAELSDGVFRPAADAPVAVLVLRPEARWVAEYYPVESFTDLADGSGRVEMRYRDASWLTRLVLGLGGDAVVEQPAELARRVQAAASEALAMAAYTEWNR
jgi:proteasome accessory factor C